MSISKAKDTSGLNKSKNKTNKEDIEPRFLTEQEIQEIIRDSIPEIRSACMETSNSVRDHISKRLYEQLKEIIITPLALQDLKNEIRKYFEKSLIAPNTSVGVMAAEALSHPVTQMVLNSFKSSGMAKQLVTGVDRARSLIYISKNIKNPLCKIFFKKNYTFEEIYFEKQKEIVGISVGQLVEDYIIQKPPKEPDQPWFYKYFKKDNSFLFSNIETGRSKSMLRLKLKRDLMYLHKVTTYMIAKTIEKESTKTKTDERVLMCIYSPTLQAIIDVYIIEDSLLTKDLLEEFPQFMFFTTTVLPSLDKMYVRGIPEIKNINIDRINIKVPFIDEVLLEKKESYIEYLINLHPLKCKASGIYPKNYERILSRLDGILDIKISGYTIRVKTDAKLQDSPMKIIDQIILKEDEEQNEYDKKNMKSFYSPSELYKDYYIYYIETEGSNLKAILQIKDVDQTRVVSNDPNEMFEVFGIETARTFLINELNNTLSMDKSYIDPRHIILLVDFQTYLGVLTPATYSGVQKQPIGAISKATFEKPLDIFKKKAPFGQIEEVKSVSAAVAIGAPIPLGTGKVKVEQLENIRLEKSLEEIDSITCEKVDNKVMFQIENEQGPIERKEIEFKEEEYEQIGANIQEEIQKAKEEKTIKLPDVSKFLEFFKNLK